LRLYFTLVSGSQEWLRASFLRSKQIKIVLRVPNLLADTRVGIGPLVEQLFHEIQIGQRLLQLRSRLRIEHARRPFDVDRGVQRGHARVGRDGGSSAVIQQVRGKIELPVDRGNDQCRRAVGGPPGV